MSRGSEIIPDRIRGLQTFCQRWLEQADSYDTANLAGSYDAFFSVFVAYNALYSEVVTRLKSNDKVQPKDANDDNKNATLHVPLYLEPALTANEIRKDLHCLTSVHEFIGLINDGTFYIHITRNPKHPDREKDRACIKGIEEGSDKEFCESILTLIHKTRCNMFHGSKEFCPKQPVLLNPMTVVLGTVVRMLIRSLSGPHVEAAVVD
jgi:hypothetical protein